MNNEQTDDILKGLHEPMWKSTPPQPPYTEGIIDGCPRCSPQSPDPKAKDTRHCKHQYSGMVHWGECDECRKWMMEQADPQSPDSKDTFDRELEKEEKELQELLDCECHCHKTLPGPDCVCTIFECKHCTPPLPKEIEEEFDQMVLMVSRIPSTEKVFALDLKSSVPLKSWFAKVYQQAYEEGQKGKKRADYGEDLSEWINGLYDVDKARKEAYEAGQQQALADLKKKVLEAVGEEESKRKDVYKAPFHCGQCGFITGFNACRFQVLENLNKIFYDLCEK